MPTREDDDFDVVAGLSASRDDSAGRPTPKRKATQRAAPTKPAQAAPGHSALQGGHSPADTAQPVAKGGHGLVWLLALVLLVVIGVCGWLGQQVLQLQQQQASSSNALQLERSRMESISAQVHETDSSFAETGNVLESKFNFFESEIRKLWDVSNKRNRKAIDANTAQLKKSTQAVKAAQGKLLTLNKGQTTVATAVEKLNRRLASENTALRASLEAQSEQLLLMEGEMEVLQQRLNKVPNDLSARVAINEEAVRSIDASRQQLVGRLTQLQKKVDELTRSVPAAP